MSAEDKRKSARERADARFSKAQQTTDDSKAFSEAELAATRGKTARLKALRLEKEAGEDQPEEPKKPRPRAKARKRSSASPG